MSEVAKPERKTLFKQVAVGAVGVALLPLREITRCAFPENKKLEKIATVVDIALNLSLVALPLLSIDFQIPVLAKFGAVVISSFAIVGKRPKNFPSV